jgi:O-methyltransferase
VPLSCRPQDLYLDLIKECVTGSLLADTRGSSSLVRGDGFGASVYSALNRLLRPLDLELCRPFSRSRRDTGRDWPAEGETMIGRIRLENLHECVVDVLRNGVPGDFIETGAWRGGACIFMRAALKAYGDQDRIVWVADSFKGLPKPDGTYPEDAGDEHWRHSDVLGVSLSEVQSNFSRYGLLDDQVKFLEGWFKDTLPSAGIGQLAILRLDGDMYGSTMDSLTSLYSRLSSGGYAIVDDYGAVPACRKAVDDFRSRHGINEPIKEIDWTGVFWQKG